jgi:site-specific recombinase XerD
MRISEHVTPWVEGHRRTAPSRKAATYGLARFAQATGDPDTADLTGEHVDVWWRSIAHLAPGTLRQNHSLVRCFLAWLRACGHLDGDPIAAIAAPREPRRVPQTIPPADVDAMRHACTNMRDRAVIELAWGIGLRCVEVSRLQVGDVDWRDRLVIVRGKGGNNDVLPLPERVGWVLDAYLSEHPATAGPLVRDLRWHRHPLSAAWVSQLVARIATDAGVKRGAYDGRGAHGLRRTCATELLDSGANIRQVQAVLRHASLSSTERYLRRSTAQELRGVMEGRIATVG